MKQTMDLRNMGLLEINPIESLEITGGGVIEMLGKAIGATVHFIVYAAIDGHKNPIRPSEYR